jgi:hypothetical protein
MQQTLVVSGISLIQADHGAASGERRSDAEPDSTRSRSLIEMTTAPLPVSGRPTAISFSSPPPDLGLRTSFERESGGDAGKLRLRVLMLCPTEAQPEIRRIIGELSENEGYATPAAPPLKSAPITGHRR